MASPSGLIGLIRRRVIAPLVKIKDTPENIAGGISLGLWVAMTPTMGGQMIISALLAGGLRWFGIRWNVLAACILCWITNPVTAIPIYWSLYLVGCLLTGQSPLGYDRFAEKIPIEAGLSGAFQEILRVGLMDFFVPLWIGSLVVGTLASVGIYPISVRLVDRAQTRWRRFRRLKRRRDTRQIFRFARWQAEGRQAPVDVRPGTGRRYWWQDYPLFLASASQSRRDALAAMKMNFEVRPPPPDERPPGDEPIERQVVERALEKARSVIDSVEDGWIVAGYTLVVHGGEVLDPMALDRDPVAILGRLSGDVHEVVTGLALVDARTGEHLTAVDTSRVHFRHLGQGIIEEYIESGRGEGQAGAYELHGMDDPLIERVEGDRTTVLGLPRNLLIDMMERMRRQGNVARQDPVR